MRNLQIRAAILALSGMVLTGCASQNAMTMVPDLVKTEIAAEKLRRMPEPAAVSVDAMLAAASKGAVAKPADTAQKPAPQKAPPKAAAIEPRVPALPAYDEAEIPPGQSAADLFAEAMAMRDAPELALNAPQPAPDVWQRFQDQHAGPDGPDLMTTAALPQRAASDPAEVIFNGETLDRDSDLKIRLMVSAGRKAERIVIGRVMAATPFEALAAAQARASAISALTGGEPLISYDPAMSAGAAVVHFAHNARLGG